VFVREFHQFYGATAVNGAERKKDQENGEEKRPEQRQAGGTSREASSYGFYE
jgi:hypothetical protein